MICRNVFTCKRLCLPVAGVLQLHFVPFVIASPATAGRGDLNGATASTAKRLPRRSARLWRGLVMTYLKLLWSKLEFMNNAGYKYHGTQLRAYIVHFLKIFPVAKTNAPCKVEAFLSFSSAGALAGNDHYYRLKKNFDVGPYRPVSNILQIEIHLLYYRGERCIITVFHLS